ncbi:MAG: porin [Nevskiaceae bacterium]|nr:MAG: porin [Nevskiaceae bacterium]TAM23233.1 MAG: porin [Nevskiaceae bacterium]
MSPSALVRRQPRKTVLGLLALSSFVLALPTAEAASDAERVGELEQRLLVLERKLEIQQEEAAAKAKEAPSVTAGDKGFSIKNAKGDAEIRFNAVGQVDGRYFLDDDGAFRDGFVTRRLRPTIQGSVGKLVGFRFTPEFAGSTGTGDSASIVDAYFDLRFDKAASLRVGKQKGPIGLERLQSGGAISFIERSFPTELAPNRDLGVALFGELANSTVSYTLGIYNGTADGRDVSTADDGLKEVAGRLFFEPFKNDYSAFKGLGFGIAGSTGAKDGGGNNNLPRYRTSGQNQFFAYDGGAAATATAPATPAVIADGRHSRYSPQGYFYYNNLGLLAEYIVSDQKLARGGLSQNLKNDAYQFTVSYVLTGEDASYRGVKPSAPYAIGAEGWGALELVARASSLSIDDDAFLGTTTGATASRLANPNSNARQADSYGIGLNWYLNSNAKLTADYNETRFEGGAAAGADRADEKALFTRLTIQY